MKSNLLFNADVLNWYCAMIELKVCLEHTLKEVKTGVYADEEFCSHLRVMKDIHASLFCEHMRKLARNRSSVKTTACADAFEPFIQERYRAWQKEQEYRESNSYLYD